MDNKKDIADELINEGINLPTGIHTPFEIPELYFDRILPDVQNTIAETAYTAKLPKQLPFELPDNYWQDAVEQLHNHVFITDLPKQTPYQVPAQYFEISYATLLNSIKAQHNKPATLKPLRGKYRHFAIAASITLILSMGFFMITTTSHTNIEQQIAALPSTEIEAYIQEHQVEFNSDIVFETPESNLIDEQKLEGEILEQHLEGISEEELKNYL